MCVSPSLPVSLCVWIYIYMIYIYSFRIYIKETCLDYLRRLETRLVIRSRHVSQIYFLRLWIMNSSIIAKACNNTFIPKQTLKCEHFSGVPACTDRIMSYEALSLEQ